MVHQLHPKPRRVLKFMLDEAPGFKLLSSCRRNLDHICSFIQVSDSLPNRPNRETFIDYLLQIHFIAERKQQRCRVRSVIHEHLSFWNPELLLGFISCVWRTSPLRPTYSTFMQLIFTEVRGEWFPAAAGGSAGSPRTLWRCSTLTDPLTSGWWGCQSHTWPADKQNVTRNMFYG